MNQQESLTLYLGSFISSLVHAGVKDVVISPGSRSTPLAMLFAEHPDVNTHIQIDERSAAFFALGLTKASLQPVAILCTSGTAAANYYPAVVEANLSRLPLIVLTADRPHELRDVGAAQAIDQIHLYGSHVKWFVDMALPESGETSRKYAETFARRAVTEAMSMKKGPVHINFPLREPLIPLLDSSVFQQINPKKIQLGHVTLNKDDYQQFATQLGKIEKGLIICGQIDLPGFTDAVKGLATKLKYPIIADPLSQLRSEISETDLVMDSYDAILKVDEAVEKLKPEIIIQFGQFPVSKPLALYIKKHGYIDYFVVDGGAGWRDPQYAGTTMVPCDEIEFCQQVTRYVSTGPTSTQWVELWEGMNGVTKKTISTYVKSIEALEEGKAIYELSSLVPDQSTFFVGNSMPIRDIDTFFHNQSKNVRIMANRGANGIDGVVSTALGAAVYKQPLFLIIGDLSFFHDMNGLLAAKLQSINMTIVLLNNDGGGIFSYLPQYKEPKHFELLFGTPTGLNFEHAASLYGAHYTKVEAWDSYRQAIHSAGSYGGLSIIEVPTDRKQNLDSHKEMWQQVSREINKYLQDVEK